MFGQMMDRPLLLSAILRHAELQHPNREIVSITADQPRHRYTFREAFARSRKLANALQRMNLQQGDRKFVLTLPAESEKDSKDYEVNFKFFQRVEGTFKVAPEAVVKSLQIRVFENGSIAPKLLQTVSVS